MPEINPVALPGLGRTPGDGELYIRIVDMGQGDCIYVIFPNGKRMMVDCGSTRWDGLGLGDFMTPLDYHQFDPNNPLLTYLEVDVLVLTHGDQDHYSLFDRLVGASPVQWVYYGGDWHNDFTLYNFRNWLYRAANFQHRAQQLVVNAFDPNPKIIIDGSLPGGVPCFAYAVAGCVTPAPGNTGDAWRKNTNSVVLKISFGADSALLCGDATSDTENFLIATRRDLSVRSLTMPHHGSTSSSTDAFVAATNPNYVAITAKDGNGYALPRYSRVARWANGVAMTAEPPQDQHWITTYDDYGNEAPVQTRRNIWQTGVSGNLTITMNGL